MAARKVQTSKVADSIAALMDALKDEILPDADELRKEGWISVSDYASAAKKHPSNCKRLLDGVANIEKCKAVNKGKPTTMYRIKK